MQYYGISDHLELDFITAEEYKEGLKYNERKDIIRNLACLCCDVTYRDIPSSIIIQFNHLQYALNHQQQRQE